MSELRIIKSLPTPSSDISIREIIEFKNSREQELFKFRKVIRENMDGMRNYLNFYKFLKRRYI
jgi:hypothetical protein